MESFYWATATIMLIGTKGDNFIETLFATSILFLTVGIFGYLINRIGMILDEINLSKKMK